MKKIKTLFILLLIVNAIACNIALAQYCNPVKDNCYNYGQTIGDHCTGVYTPNINNCSCTGQSGTRDLTKKRVLWVNDFLTFNNTIYANSGVNFLKTILGSGTFNSLTNLYSNETALLQYAHANGFTSLIFYQVSLVLDNSNSEYNLGNTLNNHGTYVQNLQRFIIAARSGGFGITSAIS